MLLGRENRDIDLVTALPPEELSSLGFRRIEATSGATVYFKHGSEFGIIEATSIKSMDGLESDLLRRDFTVNAMAMDLSGKVIDPLGGGEDLKSWRLRACGEATFRHDPLRLFRAFRFETDGWRMAPETETLIRRDDWDVAFSNMPVERFSAEMLKALEGEAPERFFQLMIELNIGTEILPELFRMPQIPAGPLQHHPEGDLLAHSIQVLQRVATASPDPLPRFCGFFHDLGKLATDPEQYPKHHGHDTTGFGMAVEFCSRLCLPTTYRKALAWISSLHGKANIWDGLRDSTKITMAEQAIKGGIVDILPLVAAADKPDGQPMAGWEDAVRVAGMSTREMAIDQEKLEAMPIRNLPPFILQKRVDLLRGLRGPLRRSD